MKQVVTWVFVVSLLGVFSSVMLGSAFARGESVHAAATKLTPIEKGQGRVVVLEPEQSVLDRVKDHAGLGSSIPVCVVSTRTFALLQALYDTTASTIDGVTTVTVHDADAGLIRQILHQNPCELVHKQRTFFLPFDPHTS